MLFLLSPPLPITVKKRFPHFSSQRWIQGRYKCNCWCYLTSTCLLLFWAAINQKLLEKVKEVKETMFKKKKIHLTILSGEIYSYVSLTSSSKPSNDINSKPSHAIYLIISLIAIQKSFPNISFEFFLVEFQLLLLIKGYHQQKQLFLYFFCNSRLHIRKPHSFLHRFSFHRLNKWSIL